MMSHLGSVVNNISKGLTEGLEPGRVVTLVEYNAFLADLGPRKVQELVQQPEHRTVGVDGEVDEFDTLKLHLSEGGLLAAWREHCRRMGWVDQAFTEAAKAAHQGLFDKLVPIDSVHEDEN